MRKGFRAGAVRVMARGVGKLPQLTKRKRETNVKIKTYVVSWMVTVESDSEQGAAETAAYHVGIGSGRNL